MAAIAPIPQTHLAATGGPAPLAVSEQRAPLLPEADEVFRGIYTRAGLGVTPEVVAVCSAIAGEGRTTLSLGLAVSLARDFPDRRVLLVEADLHTPVLARDFDVEPSPGLSEHLLGTCSLEDALRPTSLENLDLLPAGSTPQGAGRLVRSARMAIAIDSARQAYDLVFLDIPAILVNSDSLVLADLADALIFVVRAGVTPVSITNRALEQVDQARLRGVVLNDKTSSAPGWLRRVCGF